MIRYALICDANHRFESWFSSGAAFETLRDGAHLSCPICGSGTVDKALMAPRVGGAVSSGSEPSMEPPASGNAVLSAPPDSPVARAIGRLKAFVEANTENVGRRFVQEARAIHDGTAPARAIRGQATGAEAKALVDDGIDAIPLPFPDTSRTN